MTSETQNRIDVRPQSDRIQKIDDVKHKKVKTSDRALHWYHWLVILASFMLTLSASYLVSEQNKRKSSLQFEYQAQLILDLIQERLRKYEDALWGGVALLETLSGDVSRQEWLTYSEALSLEVKYPGINGIGIIYYVLPEELPDFLAKQRIERPDFQVYPDHAENEYWPITYIEPVAINSQAVGLDMAHETNRYLAAKKARDTGSAQITAPIILVQDDQKTPGFLFFAPHYHGIKEAETPEMRLAQFNGIVYAPFIMKKLMSGTLRNKNRLVNLSIRDAENLLYDEFSEISIDYDPSPLYTKNVSINVYGRIWDFNIRSSLLFKQQQSNKQPLIILIGGLLIDGILIILFLTLASTNKKAKIYAQVLLRRDLKNKRLLDEKEALFAAAVESSTAGFAIEDLNGRFVKVNAAFANWLGYTMDEMLDMNITDVLPDYVRSTGNENISRLYTSEIDSIRAEKQHMHKDGYLLWGMVSISTLQSESGEVQNLVIQVIDIDETKRLALQLEKRNVELERSNTELDQFAYVASHDLKAPLNAINQLSGWIEEDCSELLPETSSKHFELLGNRVSRMVKLLDDLLMFSRVTRVQHELEMVNLKALTSEAILLSDSSNFTCKSKDIDLLAPRIPIELVLRNLIGNAIKHHHKAIGVIEVTAETTSSGFVLRVSDDGPGIPAQFYTKAVEMFQTLKPRDEVEGSGMGLAICKKIVEFYDGTLSIESNAAQGTTIVTTWQVTNFQKEIH